MRKWAGSWLKLFVGLLGKGTLTLAWQWAGAGEGGHFWTQTCPSIRPAPTLSAPSAKAGPEYSA